MGAAPHYWAAWSCSQDDFESGIAEAWSPSDPADWQVAAGSGTNATSVYQRDSIGNSSSLSTAGDPSWDDLVIEAKVNVNAFAGTTASDRAGICARVSAGNYDRLALRGDGRMEIGRVSNDVETILTTTSTAVITAETWYTVRLEAIGPNLTPI